MKLTKAGKRLLATALAQELEIHFTRGAIGSGNLDEGELIHELEDLKHWEMDLPITSTRVIGNGTAEITCYLTNAQVNRGFKCKEHGLFALDDTGAEILFSYRNLGEENYDFIPAYTSTAQKNIFLTYEVEIDDCEHITATLDLSVAYINTEDFKSHVESKHPHPNTPNYYDDVNTTGEIWATDNDDHLHKISIENLREALKIETPESESANQIFTAREELGLNANLLFVEDFTSSDATDYFKLQVTSCAENGDLIGVADITQLKTGAVYVIADNSNAEAVQIKSVRKNASGYYAKLNAPLANSYVKPYLYRTTPGTCPAENITWRGDAFCGVNSNLTRELILNLNYVEITGAGLIADDYFTIA